MGPQLMPDVEGYQDHRGMGLQFGDGRPERKADCLLSRIRHEAAPFYGQGLLKVKTLPPRLKASQRRSPVMRTLKHSLVALVSAAVFGPFLVVSAYAASVLASALMLP